MASVFDATRLWGIDHWAKENKPEWVHFSGVDEWHHAQKDLCQRGHEIRGAAIMPFPSTPDGTFLSANSYVAKASPGIQKNLAPIYAVRPDCGAQAVDELATADELHPSVGIKLWPYLGKFNLDDLLLNDELLGYLRRYKKSVLMHVGNGRERATRPLFPDVRATPDIAVKCAIALDDIPVVIGHVARLCPKTLDLVREVPNAYLDLSGLTSLGRWKENGEDGLPVADGKVLASLGPYGVLDRLITEFGLEDKLVFGSTWPFCSWWGLDVTDDVDFLDKSDLSASIKHKIFWENALICGLRPEVL
ncbi:amidohydrolase family protein [Ensifer sp. ENS09]|uniref:amidohydrolase family protein n=1 Tax=Ensifer sp. ENS09 TaxID=2769263 RepID=UPI00177D3B03|nr:amidohydrolase family protein [Ensifer sp. ENS09]MBD9653127.1 amidohydrolase family protein [Ensifer sp. ENS09]